MSNVPRPRPDRGHPRPAGAQGEVYRGWRSVPVAMFGLIGLAAAAWQSRRGGAGRAVALHGVLARRRRHRAGGRLLRDRLALRDAGDRDGTPSIAPRDRPVSAGAGRRRDRDRRAAPAESRRSRRFFRDCGRCCSASRIFAARPYLPRASGWVALYYWAAGLALLWRADGVDALSPWTVGGTFGIGQLLAALVLYLSLERPDAIAAARLDTWREDDDSQTR